MVSAAQQEVERHPQAEIILLKADAEAVCIFHGI